MTLGRTSANKIKIKTDSPKGLRAVECACCQSCGGFPAFSYGPIEPTNKAKFRYITVVQQYAYDAGEFDASREPFSLSCSPYSYLDEEGNLVEGFTCASYSDTQNIQRENLYIKATYYLKDDCSCDIVRATGWHHGGRSYFSSWCNAYSGVYEEQYADCWVQEMDYSFSSTVQDAVWSTVTENGITLLNQKAQPAKWHNSQCAGFTSDGCEEPWLGCDVNDVVPGICPKGPLGCGPLSFHAPEFYEGLSGAVEGGFSFRSGNYTFPVFTYRAVETASGYGSLTLHNTLSEIWGPTTEMRP